MTQHYKQMSQSQLDAALVNAIVFSHYKQVKKLLINFKARLHTPQAISAIVDSPYKDDMIKYLVVDLKIDIRPSVEPLLRSASKKGIISVTDHILKNYDATYATMAFKEASAWGQWDLAVHLIKEYKTHDDECREFLELLGDKNPEVLAVLDSHREKKLLDQTLNATDDKKSRFKL